MFNDLKLGNELFSPGKKIIRLLCLTVICFFSQKSLSLAQDNYGLAFNSFNVSQEKRTSLEIGKDKPLCFSDNADISFDFYFIPGRGTYFGYLFRLINNAGQNVDLLYNQKDLVFNTVVGGTFSNINFSVDSSKLYASWTNIRYHFSSDALSCYLNGKLYKTVKIALKDRCFKLLFGANTLHEFSTTDVPPMVVRNISVKDNNVPRYFWALSNGSGSVADNISHEKAVVYNPVWQADIHAQWQALRTVDVKGNASIAYDPEDEVLHIVADDSVYRLPVDDMMSTVLESPSSGYHLYQGNQSVYNTVDSGIYNFYIDKNEIAGFDPQRSVWDHTFDSVPNTEYGHTSRVYVKEENALYIFGGYGQMKYKNRVQRYDFTTKKWEDITAGGDYFTPRYLAAATKSGNDIYILGGYGSHSGDQLLNPGYLYDLVKYNIPTHTFKKIYSLSEPDTSFVFAGSMYIDSVEKVYYALCFDRSKYDTKLRLIKGSLLKPHYEFTGNEIPYSFHDIVSDADLFYSAHSRQLIAVTQLVDLGEKTRVKIYGIAFPPENIASSSSGGRTSKTYIYVLAGVIILLVIVYLLFVRRKKTGIGKIATPETAVKKIVGETKEPAINETGYNNVVHSELANKQVDKPDFILQRENPVIIKVFGTFEMLDGEGEDVSRHFSPLLKEMFLVILLYTLKNGKGITSEKLNEIFWENKTGKNARNNLSVNIVRLKNILNKIGSIQIAKDGENWHCEYDNKNVSIDLADYLQLRAAYPLEHGKPYLDKVLYFLSRGAFLKQMESPWLDDIKADVNNKIIDELTGEIVHLDAQHDAEYIIEVANCIAKFDPLNEDALRYKCKTLDKLGRHSIAKTTYERFAKEYRKSYGEDFALSFNDVLK